MPNKCLTLTFFKLNSFEDKGSRALHYYLLLKVAFTTKNWVFFQFNPAQKVQAIFSCQKCLKCKEGFHSE